MANVSHASHVIATAEAERRSAAATGRVPRSANGFYVGFLIACIAPAGFWTLVVALVASAIGEPLSTTSLLVISGSIAAFLGVIFSALASGR